MGDKTCRRFTCYDYSLRALVLALVFSIKDTSTQIDVVNVIEARSVYTSHPYSVLLRCILS